MRVFYVDEDELKQIPSPRNYYVKMDHMDVPFDLKGYTLIKASNTQELLEKVKEYYGLNLKSKFGIQLWSSQMYTGLRLDTMDAIPEEYEFIWARIVVHNKDK